MTMRTSAPLTAALTAVPVAVPKSMLPPSMPCTVKTGFKKNDLGVDTFVAEKAALPRHPERQVQRAARNHGDANGEKFGGLFRGSSAMKYHR